MPDRKPESSRVTITLAQIRELKERHERGATHAELAETYGLTEDAIDLLCHGSKRRQRRWLHSPGSP